MSSSNQVRITAIIESVYGTTPGSGNFETVRFTTDSLSGTPETTESQSLRTDRYSSGQVVTGQTVGGDINIELAKEDIVDDFIQCSMMSTWATDTPESVDITIDTTAGTLTRGSGSFVTDGVEKGDVILLGSFSNSENNVEVMITAVAALELSYVGPAGMVDETGSGTTYEIQDKIEIGTTQYSMSMEKAFLDLTTKAINYTGMLVSGFSLSVAYGSIVTKTFSFSGNGQTLADASGEFITNGRTINAAATTNSLNGSVDMAFIATGETGTFQDAAFCIQSVELSLDNGLNPQNCIGSTAPESYSLGTASINVSITAYLDDDSWSLLNNRLTQTPFEVGFIVKNTNGWYAYYLPAVQVTFDDPGSEGINTDVLVNMTGVAKVGSSGESPLKISRSS